MSTEIKTTSPIDDSIVWRGTETTSQQVNDTIERARIAGEAWRRVDPRQREQIVRDYGQYIDANRDEITKLITREVGKLPWDAAGEVNAAVAKAEISIGAFGQRRSR
ncbi:MAG: aldehyde dehydrogenase family protein, partial [Pirellulaceae bacterium]|nr:aldehyde dehydrogenase family protein [Pirellulaceae bacterium]